tara:strand:+ start:613 stop:1767 length:1155 start_codon:yes stop_codon:yes gene_type:complete
MTFLSLLLGGAALIVVLTQVFPPENASGQQAAALVWNPSTAEVVTGTPDFSDGELQLELDNAGAGLLYLSSAVLDTADYSFIHLALESSSNATVVSIVWTMAQDSQDSHAYTLESQAQDSLWLLTDELRGWKGNISTLGLRFSGRPGDTVRIVDFSLFPSSASRQLLAIHSDLTSYAPWNSAAMNTYTGVFNAAAYYPTMLAVALLVLSLLAYGAMLLAFRTSLSFNPAVIALIFFGSWIILDMYWQNRLLHQLVDTHEQFVGKSTEEKLAVGPDKELYAFVSRAKPLMASMGSPDARVFVASSDNYSGMRTAYYFYPMNVFWSLYGPELPARNKLRSGDYIVLIPPSIFHFDPAHNRIVAPKRQHLNAELVLSDDFATVVRMK